MSYVRTLFVCVTRMELVSYVLRRVLPCLQDLFMFYSRILRNRNAVVVFALYKCTLFVNASSMLKKDDE